MSSPKLDRRIYKLKPNTKVTGRDFVNDTNYYSGLSWPSVDRFRVEDKILQKKQSKWQVLRNIRYFK